MKYTYVDGSGNTYKLQNNMLHYNPMRPELSSSGIYSGGEPFVLELDKKEILRLVDVFERALWASSDHSDKRSMGCGTLIKTLEDDSDSVYLSFKSDSVKAIDSVFENLDSRKK